MFEWIGDQIGKIIWNNLLMWLYETIYQAVQIFCDDGKHGGRNL